MVCSNEFSIFPLEGLCGVSLCCCDTLTCVFKVSLGGWAGVGICWTLGGCCKGFVFGGLGVCGFVLLQRFWTCLFLGWFLVFDLWGGGSGVFVFLLDWL